MTDSRHWLVPGLDGVHLRAPRRHPRCLGRGCRARKLLLRGHLMLMVLQIVNNVLCPRFTDPPQQTHRCSIWTGDVEIWRHVVSVRFTIVLPHDRRRNWFGGLGDGHSGLADDVYVGYGEDSFPVADATVVPVAVNSTDQGDHFACNRRPCIFDMFLSSLTNKCSFPAQATMQCTLPRAHPPFTSASSMGVCA
jgi:hypothetical protein